MEGMVSEMQAPPQPLASEGYFFMPLMISMACMLATFLAIVIYHLLVVNFCIGQRHRQAVAEIIARGSGTAGWNRDCPVGVEEKVLRGIPILSYSVDANLGSSDFGLDRKECVVCLGEMEEGAAVRVLPSCRHMLHVPCIDRWFLAHSNCPVCRSPVAPPVEVEPSPTDDGSSQQPRRLSSTAGLHHHAVSLVLPMEVDKPPHGHRHHLQRLCRSLSMDQADVVININSAGTSATAAAADLGASSSYCSNNLAPFDPKSGLLESGSSGANLDPSSSKLIRIKSLSQLRIEDVEAATVMVV